MHAAVTYFSGRVPEYGIPVDGSLGIDRFLGAPPGVSASGGDDSGVDRIRLVGFIGVGLDSDHAAGGDGGERPAQFGWLAVAVEPVP
jgi:hypothetical protein